MIKKYISGSIIFEFVGIANWIIFFQLAMKWQQISKEWHEMDTCISDYEYTVNLRKRFIKMLLFFLVIAISMTKKRFKMFKLRKFIFQLNMFLILLIYYIQLFKNLTTGVKF